MRITTADGFSCSIDLEALGDWEIIERLIEIEHGKLEDMPAVMIELIGEDGYHDAKEHVRNEKGRVPSDKMMALFFDIMTAGKEAAPEDKKK